MKRWVILCLAALLSLPAAAKGKADRVSAMTYNIRLDLASDGEDAWPHRRKALTSLVAYYGPDFVGMQEVLLHQKRDVEADLPGYKFVGVARDDGRQAGEYSMLGYRTDRFTPLGSGTFWLSPTPDVPSKGWDAALPRIATWARLRDGTGQVFLVVNTHFDHIGEIARIESAKLIRRWVGTHRRPGDAVILMGDFNSATGSAPYKAMLAPIAGLIALHDTQDLSRTPHFGPQGTFTAFRIDALPDSPIDHIFVTDGVAVLRHATITQQTGGRLPSDHYPVLTDLCVGAAC